MRGTMFVPVIWYDGGMRGTMLVRVIGYDGGMRGTMLVHEIRHTLTSNNLPEVSYTNIKQPP